MKRLYPLTDQPNDVPAPVGTSTASPEHRLDLDEVCGDHPDYTAIVRALQVANGR